MIGAGKLIKQAKKMQQELQTIQAGLAQQVLSVFSGGGAIEVQINGSGKFLAVKIHNPDILKEDVAFVGEAFLTAIQEASTKAEELKQSEMGSVASGFSIPGLL